MPTDTIGLISVPAITNSGLTFDLIGDYNYAEDRSLPSVSHRFGDKATLSQQTFLSGIGPRQFKFQKKVISYTDANTLKDFFESMQGGYQSFTYAAPNSDGTTTNYNVIFENKPLSVQSLVNACQAGITFLEVPDPTSAPEYDVDATVTRFPSSGMQTALYSTVQQIIPLVHIRVRDTTVPDVYLSDQRCTIGGQLYLPRLLAINEKGSNVVMSQSIQWMNDDQGSDNVSFTFGNADRIMTKFMNSTDMSWASIDLCLYHVNSSTVLQLWKGYIVNCVSDGSPKFQVMCSDGFYQAGQLYPTRTISRSCWKTFNDGVNCPYSSKGSGGDPSSCDYGYDTTNGCLSHGMQYYFGGHPTTIQSALIKNNSTGVFGIGRSKVTATSIISDTIFGNALPEIWCNQGNGTNPGLNAFVTNCQVIDVRDEGDFFDVLAIVGAGPIGAYTIVHGFGGELETNSDGLPVLIAPMADGLTAQGFKLASSGTSASTNNDLGLRQVFGYDPIQQLSGTYTNPSYQQFELTGVGANPNPLYFAAGTAFVEIRYPKPSAIQPSSPIEHSATTPVAQGLYSWRFDNAGNRSAPFMGETNPFWIAINSYFRALGLADIQGLSGGTPTVDPATQLALFNLASVFAGDGTGSAEIADLQVPPILSETGATVETQFQFQGILASQKPFRQWLQEILNSGLGYYLFEFGALKLGIRENASSTSAFTLGNMLYQSLSLSPINPTFEKLTISFADQAYQYQQNTTLYEDKTHEAYYNRVGAPLSKTMNLVGVPSASQAARIAATRTREEIGGVTLEEYGQARIARWKTTILSLDTEPGQVVSITHPDIPGSTDDTPGTMNFRIKSWRLLQDWSIEIEAQTVTVSMYDVDMGPKPLNVGVPALKVLFYPQPQGEWAPFQVQADSGDAMFPSEYSFDLSQSYIIQASNTPQAFITASGVLPVNQFIPNIGAPTISKGNISISSTGGNVPGGTTYKIAVTAHDANNIQTPPSDILVVQVPSGTDTNVIGLGGVILPNDPNMVITGTNLYASQYDDLICYQGTLDGPIQRSTWALPDPDVGKVRLKVYRCGGNNATIPEGHGGVLGAAVTLATGSTIISSECVDITATDDWTGRKLYLIGRPPSGSTPGDAPFDSYNITAFDPSSGQFTLDRATSAQAGDAFAVSFGYGNATNTDTDNSANQYVFSDPGIKNALNVNQSTGNPDPFCGLTTNFESGLALYVWAGTSRGMTAKIVSNTIDTYTFDTPVPLDSTSVPIICSVSAINSVDSADITNANPMLQGQIVMPVTNYLNQTLLVIGVTVSDDGVESEIGDAPARLLYLFGRFSAPTQPPGATFIYGENTDGQPANIILNGTCNVNIAQTGGIINTSAVNSYSWLAYAWTPPDGSDATFDIYRFPLGASRTSATVIGTVTLAQGIGNLQFGDFAPNITIAVGDSLYAQCTQVGSITPGQRITIQLYWTPQVPASS
jgi:Putative phage tail protein